MRLEEMMNHHNLLEGYAYHYLVNHKVLQDLTDQQETEAQVWTTSI
jgi:hypothetical protein